VSSFAPRKNALSRSERRHSSELPGRGPTTLALILLVVVVLPPTLTPILVSLFDADAWRRLWSDAPRLFRLYGRTLALALSVAGIVVPTAAVLAVALFRFRLPGTRVIAFLMLVAAFTPLAVFCGGWQSCIGPYGFIRAWSRGMPTIGDWPAVLALHSAAALPWATAIIAIGVRRVSKSLEESALLDAGPLTVVRTVTLPQVRPSLILAGLLAAAPIVTDMTATDLFSVRTLAEEVYTQLAHSQGGERTTTLALAPLSLLTAGLLAFALLRWRDSCLRPMQESRPLPWTSNTRIVAAAALLIFAISLMPIVGLIWQLGLIGGEPETTRWSGSVAARYLCDELRKVVVARERPGELPLLPREILRCALTALATVAVAFPTAWWWRWANSTGRMLGALLVGWLVALPGPVLALGLIDLFHASWLPNGLASLYDTTLPMFWAQVVRTLPIAWVIIGAAMEQMDGDAIDAARVAGAGSWGILGRIALPTLEPTLWLAGVGCMATILTELPTAKLLAPPGTEPLSMRIFSLLHQGTANQQAALCLVSVGAACGLAMAAWWISRGRGG
jgi:iron(III) transport system permease protein